MKLEDIIELFGKQLNKNLVVKRELFTDSAFKAYKTYRITLFEIENVGINEITTFHLTDRIIDTTKDKIVEKAEKEFLQLVIKHYVGSKQISNIDN